eukprot:12549155-Alexandrium_andersonii.AAC.1
MRSGGLRMRMLGSWCGPVGYGQECWTRSACWWVTNESVNVGGAFWWVAKQNVEQMACTCVLATCLVKCLGATVRRTPKTAAQRFGYRPSQQITTR